MSLSSKLCEWIRHIVPLFFSKKQQHHKAALSSLDPAVKPRDEAIRLRMLPGKFGLALLRSTPMMILFALGIVVLAMMAPFFFHRYIGKFDANNPGAFLYLLFFSFTCFFILPAAAAKWIFGFKLRDLGLQAPQGKLLTVFLISGALIILMPSIYYLTKQPHFLQYYTLKHPTLLQLSAMTILFPIYYIAEEFFFRGFLFLGLWQRVKWHSFWITEIIFTLSHIGKPGMEIVLCIPASVVFNCLSLYTRSFYPAFIVHYTIGTFCLLLVNIGRLHG